MPITGRHSRGGARSRKKSQNLKNNSGGSTARCKRTWDTVQYFGLNGLSMILCLWSTLHSLSLLRAIQDHAQNLEEQLWMEGRREVSITVSHRPVTITDLKQERSFFRQTVSIFYNWLKLLVEKSIIKSWRHGCRTRIPNEKKRPNTMRVLYLLSSWDPLGVL